MSIVRNGFLQGRNSPQDVDGMATLFRRFRHSRYMSETVEIWAQADVLINRLEKLGDKLHDEISSRRPDPVVARFVSSNSRYSLISAIPKSQTPTEVHSLVVRPDD